MPHAAILGSLFLPTQPNSTGGLEVWTGLFLQEMIKKGYTFDLYATEGSINIPGKINLIPITPPIFDMGENHPFFTQYVKKIGVLPPIGYMVDLGGSYSVLMQQELLKNQYKYDFIIDSTWMAVITPSWEYFNKPVFVIGHAGDTGPKISLLQFFPPLSNVHYIFPAHVSAEKTSWIPTNKKTIIPHGIAIDNFIFSPTSLDSLTWMGRISPEKGLEDAIQVAIVLKKGLTIFGYKQHSEYFDTKIKPLLTKEMNLIENNFDHKHRNQCKALLFPTQLEEPFGISVIEALACGTPIIAYARGSMPEIIQDGVTGFLVNPPDDIRGNFITKKTGLAGLIEATEKLYALSKKDYSKMRSMCRKVTEEKYSLSRMIDAYDTLFQQEMTKKRV